MSTNGHVNTICGTESQPVGGPISPPCRTVSSAKVRLDGNVARRKVVGREFFWWDTDLPGFGLRGFPSGTKSWVVQLRQRGKQKRITLGRPQDMDAGEARALARLALARVALDGLPAVRRGGGGKGASPSFGNYAQRFWNDYARHWKGSTQKRNRKAIFGDLVPVFADQPVDAIRRADILRWRDSSVERAGNFNRTIPVMSVMMTHAEQLGLRSRGSNPCRGTPRFRRKAMQRFLSAREFARLAASLRANAERFPLAVHAIRLISFTGARRGEIEGLRWEWIQPPRIMLPDSKSGPKIVYLNSQAQAVITGIPNRAARGLVFPAPRRNRGMSLEIAWRQIRKDADLQDVRLHDLRHSFASIAIADRISLVTIGRLLGHALPETTERYAHLADEAVSDAAKRVSGSLARCLGLAA